MGAKIGPNSAVVKAVGRLQAFHIGACLRHDQYALPGMIDSDHTLQSTPFPH